MGSVHVKLEIGEIVLRGFENVNAYEIHAAIEHELSHLFVEQGLPSALLSENHFTIVNAGAFEVPGRPESAQVGAQVARSLYGGLQQ